MHSNYNMIQAGYPKSGNYWLYKNLKSLFLSANLELRNFVKEQPIYELAKSWPLSYPEQVDINMVDIFYQAVFWRISSVYRKQLNNYESYAARNSIVWTHSDCISSTRDFFRHFNKHVYIVRDPRDVAISTARFAFTKYMKQYYPSYHQNADDYLKYEYDNILRSWNKHVSGYLDYSAKHDLYIIFYERMKKDIHEELQKLAAYLEIDLDSHLFDQIQKITSVQEMKKKSPGHVRTANYYGWQQALSDIQIQKANDICGRLLQFLNYPMNDAESQLPLPNINQDGLTYSKQ